MEFKRLGKHDIPELVKLFTTAFGDTKLSKDYLNWQYFENPHGLAIGYNAYSGNQIVAHYCVIPQKSISGTRYFLSTNTATHPNFSGKGLFTKLAKLTFQYIEDCEPTEIRGVANDNSIYVFKNKLGFKHVAHVNLHVTSRIFLKSNRDLVTNMRYPMDLGWRLRNPSREYFASVYEESYLIFCKYKNVSVLVGSVPKNKPIGVCVLSIPWIFAIPLSSVDYIENSLKIPRRLLPNSWHLITKSSSSESFGGNLIYGLGMDTF